MVACVICTLLIHVDVLSCPICGSRQPRRCTTTSKPKSSSKFRKKQVRRKRKRPCKKTSSKSKRGKRRKKKPKQTIISTHKSEGKDKVEIIVCFVACLYV